MICADPAVLAALPLAVRQPLLAIPALEIRGGRLLYPLVHIKSRFHDPEIGELVLRSEWHAVLAFLEALAQGASPFYRLLFMALLDPEAWYRTRAAALFLALCGEKQGATDDRPFWPLEHRRRRLADLADLDESFVYAEPETLFAALKPFLDHRAAEPALFACDAPGSLQSAATVARLRGGQVHAEDLTAEGWLLAAVLFPHLAMASPLVTVLADLEPGADLLIDELFHRLPQASVDQLWPLLLHHPAYAAWVVRRCVAGVPHRLDHLADYFYATNDHNCQRVILEFFHGQDPARLAPLVRGALAYVLDAVFQADAADALLTAGLLGLAEVGDVGDLDLIERCRRRCSSHASRVAHAACRQAVWTRAAIDEAGRALATAPPEPTGASSPPAETRGGFTRGAQPQDEHDAATD